MLLLTESMIFFLNLTLNCTGRNPNFTLTRKVHNWITGVNTPFTKPLLPPIPLTQKSSESPSVLLQRALGLDTDGQQMDG